MSKVNTLGRLLAALCFVSLCCGAVLGASSEFDVVQAAADAWLSSGNAPNITAQDLFANLNDGDASNDPFILSVRSASQYELGHIPGAVNIPWREVAQTDNLAMLPTDTQIVVYCYTGHTGSQVTALLNALGYDAINLKFGMTSWVIDPEIAPGRYDEIKDCKDYPYETDAVSVTGTYAYPELNNTESDEAFDIIQAAADAWLSSGDAPNITAQDLFANLNDGDASNDPFILSVRSASQYELGHIPGAVNIPWREVAQTDNLATLPTDTQIVVYCYTGHTGSQITALLSALGYNAINLKFGMTSWVIDPEIAPGRYDEIKDCKDYPYVEGAEAGSL